MLPKEKKPPPWTLLYAHDLMLASQDKSELKLQTQAWTGGLALFGVRLKGRKTENLTADLAL